MNETAQTEEAELDLGRLICILLKKSWILLFAAILGTILALAGTRFLMTPKYESTVMLYVKETQSAKDLADSFDVIVKMRESLMEVIAYTQFSGSHNELRKQITVSSVNDTDFFQVTVSDADPYQAEIIADAIAEILPGQVAQIMEGTNVKVVGEAVIAAEPSSPSYPVNAVLGFVTGMMLAAGGILLQEMFTEKEKIR